MNDDDEGLPWFESTGQHVASRPAHNPTSDRLIDDHFRPLFAPRDRGRGYAVSFARRVPPVTPPEMRPPLSSLNPLEFDQLARLVASLGPR